MSKYNLSGLYIKLDEKLILRADYIHIPRSKSSPSFNNMQTVLKKVEYVLTFFKTIELKKVEYENNSIVIDFHEDILSISSKDYHIVGSAQSMNSRLNAEVSLLHLKEHNIVLDGKFDYDFQKDILNIVGHFGFEDVGGAFTVIKNGTELTFSAKSDKFSNLRAIIDKIDLDIGVKSWIVDRVEAQEYRLLSLKGRGDIVDGKFEMDFDKLDSSILFDDVKIHFHEKLKPILTDNFILSYKHKTLYFNLHEPTYLNKDLNGSKLSIVNLLDNNTTLKLDLKIHATFDDDIRHLLSAYDLDIPVDQNNSKVNVSFLGDIALKESKNKFVVDVDFAKGDVLLSGVKLPVLKGNLHYEDGNITLKDLLLKNDFYEGVVDGNIELKTKFAKLIFDAKRIELGKEKFFKLYDEKLPINLDYSSKIKVDIPTLKIKIKNIDKKTNIHINDLKKIKKYLTFHKLISGGGKVNIDTSDFESFAFKGKIIKKSCSLFQNRGKCETVLPFHGKSSKTNLKLYAFGDKIYFNDKLNRLNLKNINIDLENFLKAKDSGTSSKKLIVLGTNSNLRYGNYTLMMDSYDVEVLKNGNIKAMGSTDGDIVKFSKIGEIISLDAYRIKDKTLHRLINFSGLKGGRYSLKKKGNPIKVMKGEIIIEGGYMKDFKAYNNTLAFIDTIPSLALLQNPGYSEEGFYIEKGFASYRMIGKHSIVFDSIHIEGSSATIVGKGSINLKTKKIDMDLVIYVARQFTQFVKDLPLLGYIFLGDDKSVNIGLKIKGTLDKPKVETSAVKDIFTLPLNLIIRTFELPKHIINQESKSKN